MRLRLFARFRRSARPRPARGAGRAPWAEPRHEPPSPGPPAAGRHRRGSGREEITDARQAGRGQREPEVSPFGSPVGDVLPRQAGPRRPEPGKGTGYRAGAARAAVRMTPRARSDARPATAPVQPRPEAADRGGLPWYEVAHARRAAEGRRDCGELERLLHREWSEGAVPPPETVRAIDRLAELPSQVKEILAAGLRCDLRRAGRRARPRRHVQAARRPAAIRARHLGRVCRCLWRTQDHRRLAAIGRPGRDVS